MFFRTSATENPLIMVLLNSNTRLLRNTRCVILRIPFFFVGRELVPLCGFHVDVEVEEVFLFDRSPPWAPAFLFSCWLTSYLIGVRSTNAHSTKVLPDVHIMFTYRFVSHLCHIFAKNAVGYENAHFLNFPKLSTAFATPIQFLPCFF